MQEVEFKHALSGFPDAYVIASGRVIEGDYYQPAHIEAFDCYVYKTTECNPQDLLLLKDVGAGEWETLEASASSRIFEAFEEREIA